MSPGNYVVTALKPTSVTHSCIGNFTGPRESNLIIAKCTRIEIHLLTPPVLQLSQAMFDVPIYGRIAAIELFRLCGSHRWDRVFADEAQDLLFLATEECKYFVLQWDAKTSELVTRAKGDVSDPVGHRTNYGQIGIIDPDCRLIGLHLYFGLFKVIPMDNKGELDETFNIRLEELEVLDIKFLYGFSKPTMVVLYKNNEGARQVKIYEFSHKDKVIELPWSVNNVDNDAHLLIPVTRPLCGVLIIGEKRIKYLSANAFQAMPIIPSITKAYGRANADGSRYLLGDDAGRLHLLVITHEKEKVTGLKMKLLGETSIASTISYFDDANVFIGSSYGDSQLIKLNPQPDSKGSYVEVLERYVNFGPIVDFSVVDLERQGQGQVVTCSGAYKDGSLRIVRNGIGINEQASVELQGIKGMWSLRSSIDDPYDTFLVVSFVNETRILAMNREDELGDTEIEGFCSQVQTLFSHDAVHNQLVQVTSSSVRLVSSMTRELRNEWHSPQRCPINVATANATQVLLAHGGVNLVYLEIGDGILKEIKHVQLEYEISCLDINPIGENLHYSQLAAVGMWTDISIRIFSLPDLNLITKKHLGGEIMPRSILLCAFEGISYVSCALGDGQLLNFRLNMHSGELTDRRKVSLGTLPITLRTFSSKNTTHVFAASDRPTVIYSSNKKLQYGDVNLKKVSHVCQFKSAAFPDSLAIAKEGALAIGIIDDIQKLHIRSIPLEEQPRCICHQEQSRTFAICSWKYKQSSAGEYEMHFVRLLDDQTFGFMSTHPLDPFEHGFSILSCSFTDDSNVYYCVGTAYYLPEERGPPTGRILVFTVEDGKLRLTAEEETKGTVYSLNAFNGKLLAAIDGKIQLFKWVPRDDGSGELQSECEHVGHGVAFYVQTHGDLIVVGDLTMQFTSLLIYKHENGAIEELARDRYADYLSAFEILDDGTYLGADSNFNLFTARKSSEGTTRRCLNLVGGYHLGELINRFRRGSLRMPLVDSDVGLIPTVIFGTVNGTIGVIASLPHDQYVFLEKLQSKLRRVIKGVGGLSHEQWRSFCNEETVDAPNFLDGDLIESFLDLSRERMFEISIAMGVPVEELCERVEILATLH